MRRPLRILIPNYAAPDSFVDNVAHTLRKNGHIVISPQRPFQSRVKLIAALGTVHSAAAPNRLLPHERWALSAAKSYRPDMVLCLTQALKPEVLSELRAIGVYYRVAWWGDAPANMRGLGLLADGWDHIFIKDAAAVQKFRAVGLPATYLNECCNSDWHKRNYSAINDEIVVAGTYYGYRQILVSRLLASGEKLALYGPPLPHWSKPDVKAAFRNRFIVKEEKSLVFGSGLACLNSTALSEGNSLNCRAFEIAGACGLQLIEDKPVVGECFEPGKEVLTYSSLEELRDHVARARREFSWAVQVREAGYRRAHSEHTYSHRLSTMFGALDLSSDLRAA
jgi:spore maturation protein CgeB